MKIATFEQFGAAENIKIVERPLPQLSSNQVLVKVHAAGLNPKDILIRKGKFKQFTGRNFPFYIGFDFAGTIENPGNSTYKKGDKVFGMLNGWDGRCCAEYVNPKENELYLIPDNISFVEAAGIPLAAQTALQAIRNLGKLEKGQKILLNGASGGVGTLAIQIAKELGGQVTTISSNKNLDFCRSLGADKTLSYQDINILASKEKYAIFFDVFGNYNFKKIAPILHKKGRYVTTVPKADILKEQIFNLFRNKKGKLVVVKSNKKDLKWLSEKIASGRIQPIVDKTYSFDKIPSAQQYIETKRAKGKVIIKIV